MKRLKLQFLKNLDKYFGPILVRLLTKPSSSRLASIQNVLIIRPGGAGDAILILPTIQMFLKAHPLVRIDILAERRNEEAFLLTPLNGRVYRYDTPRDLLAVLLQRYDLVIDSEQWYRLSAVVARLCRGAIRVGFATNERGRLFNHPVPYPEGAYEADSFLRLAAAVGTPGALSLPFITVPPAAMAWARALPALQGASYVVLFPGASIKEKLWSPDRFAELVSFLAARGKRVVVVGGPAEAEVAKLIASRAGVENLVGRTDLPRTAAVIAGAEAVVSGDSVVLHLAAGLVVPTVALFGPTSVTKWAPTGEKHLTVTASAPCAPCARYGTIPGCRAATGCMEGISVGQVCAALKEILV
jgi:ADP-heptose:LPS heptosyltransferase